MIGAIAGDIIGSVYEHDPIKTKDFPLFHPQGRFTDDTVLTIAIAKAILDDRNYVKAVREIGRKYPHAGYGGSFIQRYRLRQGRYRILYSVQDDELTVWIVKVGYRKEINIGPESKNKRI